MGSGTGTQLITLAHLVARAVGLSKSDVKTTGEIEMGKVHQFLPSTKKLEELGFVPQVDLADGIDQTVKWIRKLL